MEEIIFRRTLIEKYNAVLKEVEIDLLKINHEYYIGDPLEGVETLAGSFDEFGQIEPILVKELPDLTFSIIKGVRKMNAAKSLKWKILSALIITIDDAEVFPLMQALHSHQRKFNYKNLAKRYAGLKEHAKKLLKENKVCGNQDL